MRPGAAWGPGSSAAPGRTCRGLAQPLGLPESLSSREGNGVGFRGVTRQPGQPLGPPLPPSPPRCDSQPPRSGVSALEAGGDVENP